MVRVCVCVFGVCVRVQIPWSIVHVIHRHCRRRQPRNKAWPSRNSAKRTKPFRNGRRGTTLRIRNCIQKNLGIRVSILCVCACVCVSKCVRVCVWCSFMVPCRRPPSSTLGCVCVCESVLTYDAPQEVSIGMGLDCLPIERHRVLHVCR